MGTQPLQLHVIALTTVSVEYGWMKPYNPTVYTNYRMQLQFCCNLSQATGRICSCKCRMQLKTSCIRQLQNGKFLIVNEDGKEITSVLMPSDNCPAPYSISGFQPNLNFCVHTNMCDLYRQITNMSKIQVQPNDVHHTKSLKLQDDSLDLRQNIEPREWEIEFICSQNFILMLCFFQVLNPSLVHSNTTIISLIYT